MVAKLERANVADALVLKALSMDAFSPGFEQYGGFPPGVDSIDWHLTQISTGHYYKIYYNDELAGGILTEPTSDTATEIKLLYITDNFQDKQLGSQVITLIEQCYPATKKWSLVTPYKSYRNHHFYEKQGYLKVGEFQPEPDDVFRLFQYEKQK
ncbi:GNAT family N-acetyltransferase [Photobacterium sanguinicancri]|uniref:GNAT family N-acetyltransferase n=1 Tax=Photobacterium sanguinicancri TaxID=875932 RepID=UPI00247FFECA|nr:GNAT family N-acetyltransferase [Photobacterium sanguinicancri]